MSTCRICGNSEHDQDHSVMIKYSTRHYAHADCALRKWGAEFFEKLTPWQCMNQFPVNVAKKYGAYDALMERIE